MPARRGGGAPGAGVSTPCRWRVTIGGPCTLGSEAVTTRKAGNQTVAVKLRLMRMGKKKQPTYRVVAADARSPRDGRFIEIVGTYAPRGRSTAEPDAIVAIDNDKALKWLRQGAQPTERVEKLLRTSGAWDEFKPGSK